MAKSSLAAPDPVQNGFQCTGCDRSFPTRAGLGTHRRFCQQSGSSSHDGHGGPLGSLLHQHGLNSKEGKVFKQKIAHWLLLRKNRELRNGVRSYRAWKCTAGPNDLYLKLRLKKAASSILGCIQNDHSTCQQFSFVCQNGVDPYCYLLPHGRPLPGLPPSVKAFIQSSVVDVFNTTKLDRLIYRGGLHTTSHVEAVHRTIRSAAPKVNFSLLFFFPRSLRICRNFLNHGVNIRLLESVGWCVGSQSKRRIFHVSPFPSFSPLLLPTLSTSSSSPPFFLPLPPLLSSTFPSYHYPPLLQTLFLPKNPPG